MSRVSCVASACVWVEGAMWKRGWWQRLSIGPYSSGAMPHRTDNKRRGNSLPREGLQLCVAPYFATLGRGDMRGRAVVSHPNRTPEVVRGCRIRNGAVSCCVSMLCSVMTACHRLRGGIMGAPIGGPRMSPTPRSAKYGVTHGCNPSRGSENVRLWSSTSPWRWWVAKCGAMDSCAACAITRGEVISIPGGDGSCA